MAAYSSIPSSRPTRYSWETRWLHWVTAVLVVEQFAVGQLAWHLMDRAAPLRAFLVVTHTSLGVLLAAVFVTRMTWAMTGAGHPFSGRDLSGPGGAQRPPPALSAAGW